MQPNGLMLDVDPSLLSGGNGPPPRFSGTAIRFHMEPEKDEAASQAAGCPKYREVEYIEIRTPGDRTNVVDRPVSALDKQVYAQQYAAWKAGNSQQVQGTLLSHWPPISRAQVLELEHFGCRTVEQLAEMSDVNLQNVGPMGRPLREQARAWLEAAKGAAPLLKMQSELAAKDQEMAALKQQMTELRALVEKNGKGK